MAYLNKIYNPVGRERSGISVQKLYNTLSKITPTPAKLTFIIIMPCDISLSYDVNPVHN